VSRAAINAFAGRMRPADREFETPDLDRAAECDRYTHRQTDRRRPYV